MTSLANAPSAAADTQAPTAAQPGRVEFQTHPSQYRHRQLRLDGPVATLTMDVDERGGLVPGYELKLNSYDLVVDIELYDAVQRLRFEHPEVRAVVVTSGKEKIFCAGANIRRPLIPATRRLRGHRSGCRTGHGYRRADESGPATDGQRPDPLADPVRRASRRPRGSRGGAGRPLGAEEAERTGLVTFAPDDIDWSEEVRIAIEERVGFSPDALTGLEANFRFVGPETVETKIFGRLSAWRNWIFHRPNASGPEGALCEHGTGQRAEFDRKRV